MATPRLSPRTAAVLEERRATINAGPVTRQLAQDIASVRRQAKERLTFLTAPVSAVLVPIDNAVSLMARGAARVQRQLQLENRQLEATAGMVARERFAANPPRSAQERQREEATILSRIQTDATKRLASQLGEEWAEQASAIASDALARSKALEDAVARARLDSLGIGGGEDMDLAALLNEQHTIADLESRDTATLLGYWHDLTRLDPTKARRLEPALLRVLRGRSERTWARASAPVGRVGTLRGDGTALRSMSPQDAEKEMFLARKGVGEIEAAQSLRQPPDLMLYVSEFKPQLAALMRRTIGVDPREVARGDFEQYVREYRPDARLDELPLRLDWPTRVLAPLPPTVRSTMPAILDEGGKS